MDGKFEWEPVTVDAQRIGRILAYHLVIEHYLDNYLETRTNYTLGWAAARLTFAQKIGLLSASDALPAGFTNSFRILNVIRNRMSHTLNPEIHTDEVKALVDVANRWRDESDLSVDSDLDLILEEYTFTVTVYLAGYLSGAAAGRHHRTNSQNDDAHAEPEK